MSSGIRHLPVDVVLPFLLQLRTLSKTKFGMQEGFLFQSYLGIIFGIRIDSVKARF